MTEWQGYLIGIVIGTIFLIIYNYISEEKKKENARKLKLKGQIQRADREKELAHIDEFEKAYKMNADERRSQQTLAAACRLVGDLVQKNVYQEKEKDWAILGGIADGLAGPGAGIATAIGTMQENQQIRERNAAHREAAIRESRLYNSLASNIQANSPAAISKQDYDVFLWWKPSTLFSFLRLSEPRIEVDSETGAVIVSVSCHKNNDCSICIDGSLRAKIYTSDGKCRGCAYLNFPAKGTENLSGNLSGICILPETTSKYTVVIEPMNLWEFMPKGQPTTKLHRLHDRVTVEEHRKMVADSEAKFVKEME